MWCRCRGAGSCRESKGVDVGRGPRGELGRSVGDEHGEGIRAREDIGRTGERAREGAILVGVCSVDLNRWKYFRVGVDVWSVIRRFSFDLPYRWWTVQRTCEMGQNLERKWQCRAIRELGADRRCTSSGQESSAEICNPRLSRRSCNWIDFQLYGGVIQRGETWYLSARSSEGKETKFLGFDDSLDRCNSAAFGWNPDMHELPGADSGFRNVALQQSVVLEQREPRSWELCKRVIKCNGPVDTMKSDANLSYM